MLKILLPLLVLAGALSCVQTENSDSQDAETYSDLGGHPGFAASRAIFRQACASCHSFHTLSEEELVTRGVLKLGDSASSAIYFRLVGALSGRGPRNMPSSGATLSETELRTVQTWIDGAN
jgi:mono/diheme cytochrome c family protein